MSVFDKYREQILSIVNSKWIRINDRLTGMTIEDFEYKFEGDRELTKEEKEQRLGVP